MSGIVMLVLGILLIVSAAVITFSTKKKMWLLGMIAGLMAIVLSFCAVVPTGYTGIVTTFGKVEEGTMEAGFNVIAPWQKVVTMDNREQKISFNAAAFSSDIQEVDVSGSVIFSIGKSTAVDLYRNVGINYASVVVQPQINEDVKSVISRYTAEGLIGSRATLSEQILEMLRTDLEGYGLNIISVAIENIDFTDAFESAVEAKQVATQTKQRAQTEQDQLTMEAEQAAERDRIAAQAAADVAKIQADAEAYAIRVNAEAQAAANTLVAETLTDDLIRQIQASRWDGRLPATVVGSADVLPVLNMGSNTMDHNAE